MKQRFNKTRDTPNHPSQTTLVLKQHETTMVLGPVLGIESEKKYFENPLSFDASNWRIREIPAPKGNILVRLGRLNRRIASSEHVHHSPSTTHAVGTHCIPVGDSGEDLFFSHDSLTVG
jgi:hypothetical protein